MNLRSRRSLPHRNRARKWLLKRTSKISGSRKSKLFHLSRLPLPNRALQFNHGRKSASLALNGKEDRSKSNVVGNQNVRPARNARGVQSVKKGAGMTVAARLLP